MLAALLTRKASRAPAKNSGRNTVQFDEVLNDDCTVSQRAKRVRLQKSLAFIEANDFLRLTVKHQIHLRCPSLKGIAVKQQIDRCRASLSGIGFSRWAAKENIVKL